MYDCIEFVDGDIDKILLGFVFVEEIYEFIEGFMFFSVKDYSDDA